MRIRITVRRPGGSRKTFALWKDTVFADGKRSWDKIQDEAIRSLNKNFKAGLLTFEEAENQIITVIKPRLKNQFSMVEKISIEEELSEQNLKIFTKFWSSKYRYKDLVNPRSTKNDVLAAIKFIDPLSLLSATREELQDKVNTLPNNKNIRHVIRLNQLLKFLSREFVLTRKRTVYNDVHFVTWEELQKIVKFIDREETRYLAVALWGTGARIGEAFAPSFCNLASNDTVFISKQMDIQRNIREIKNRKPHRTILLPEAKQDYLRWCAVSNKEELREIAIHHIAKAARKAFPDRKSKKISAHSFRHSYAIRLLELGANLTDVALCLGDTMATVQLHYVGFVISNGSVDRIQELVKLTKDKSKDM